MVDHATAKYLSDNIGGVLAKALAEMAIAEPNDGVDFLAQWLNTYAEQELEKGRRAEEDQKLQEARARTRAQAEGKAARKAVRDAAAAAKEAKHQDLLNKFKDPETTFQESFWAELVSAAGALTGAEAVYLGIVDEEGLDGMPAPLIRYQETTPESLMMKDKVLQQGQGVTWGAVTENPTEGEVPHLWRPPAGREPAEADPADPDAPALETPPPPPYCPISIGCVTDVAEVHYFDMTRLGAYLAVPLVYSSYCTPEAHAAARQFEEEKKASGKKRQEALEAYQKAVEEATAHGGAEAGAAVEKPPELEATEAKELVLPGQTVKMVLCMDTLGANTAIEESSIQLAVDLCSACSKCKEATEKRQVDAQAIEDIDEELRRGLEEEVAAARQRAEEETQEALQADEAECAPDEDMKRDLVHKKWAYLRAARVLLDLRETFLRLGSWAVMPQEMLATVAATAFLFGYQKEQLYPKRKSVLRWSVLCKVLEEPAFWDALREEDITAERRGLEPEQKLTAVKAMLPAEMDAEKARQLSPSLELLLSVLTTAIAYRTADLQLRKAEYEKHREEEGEAFALPPLEETDDDFEGL